MSDRRTHRKHAGMKQPFAQEAYRKFEDIFQKYHYSASSDSDSSSVDLSVIHDSNPSSRHPHAPKAPLAPISSSTSAHRRRGYFHVLREKAIRFARWLVWYLILSCICFFLLFQIPVIGPQLEGIVKWTVKLMIKLFIKAIFYIVGLGNRGWLDLGTDNDNNNNNLIDKNDNNNDNIINFVSSYNLDESHVGSFVSLLNHSKNLASIGVNLLPLSTLIYFSSQEIARAQLIVRSSTLKPKKQLESWYIDLTKNTDSLSTHIREYTTNINSMTDSIISRYDKLDQLVFGENRMIFTGISVLSTTTTSSCAAAYSRGLRHPAFYLPCFVTSILTSQSVCPYLQPSLLSDIYCIGYHSFTLLDWKGPKFFQSDYVTTQFQYDILAWFEELTESLTPIAIQTEQGRKLCAQIYGLYNNILSTQENTKDSIRGDLDRLWNIAREKPWNSFMGAQPGLTRSQQSKAIDLVQQTESLKDLIQPCGDSYVMFQFAEEQLKVIHESLKQVQDLVKEGNRARLNDLQKHILPLRDLVKNLKKINSRNLKAPETNFIDFVFSRDR